MGAVECTILALEEECDALVGAAGGAEALNVKEAS
jgi:hypothetical protein